MYSIQEVCMKTGLSAHTLRYYEKEGLHQFDRWGKKVLHLSCEGTCKSSGKSAVSSTAVFLSPDQWSQGN